MKKAFFGVAVVLLGVLVYFVARSDVPVEQSESLAVEPTVQEAVVLRADPVEPAPIELPVDEPALQTTDGIESPVQEEIDTGDAFQVQGRVLTTEGAPVESARLGLYHDTKSWGMDDGIVDETTSDSRGRFFFPALVSFDKQVNHSYTQDVFIILVTHADYAFTWKHVRPAEDHSGYVITMAPGASKTITVVDQDNNPIEGALVWPYNIYREGSADRKNNFSIQSGEFGFRSEETNREGKAVFAQIPDMNVSFYATRAGYARGLVFGGGDTIVLTLGASVSGRVLTARREPIVGAVVAFSALRWNNYIFARTDAKGRYRVTDIPANGFDMSAFRTGAVFNGDYTVSLRSDDYVAEEMSLSVELGEHVENVDIQAYAGTLLSCLVVDAHTGEPLSGVRVSAMASNRGHGGYTNKDGLYEVRVFPGETTLRVSSPPNGVYISENGSPQSSARFMAEGDRVDVELRLEIEGVLTSVTGEVWVPAGTDPAQFQVYADAGRFGTATSSSYIYPSRLDERGKFQLREVPAERDLVLYAISDDRTQAGIASLFVPAPPEQAEGISIRLEATYTVEAVLTNDDDEPLPNASLSISPIVGGNVLLFSGWNVQTGEDGSYVSDGILRGLEYLLSVRPPGTALAGLGGRPNDENRVVLVE